MSKQSEQVLEEQLALKIKALALVLGVFNGFTALKINRLKNLILKMFTEFKKGATFVATVPVLLPVRSACGSFFFKRLHVEFHNVVDVS